jgi:hypothetical protein
MTSFWQRLITPLCVRRLEETDRYGTQCYSVYYVFGIRIAVVGRWRPE